MLLLCFCVTQCFASGQTERVNVVVRVSTTESPDTLFSAYVKQLEKKEVISLELYAPYKEIGWELNLLGSRQFSHMKQLSIWTSCEELHRKDLSVLSKLKLHEFSIRGGSHAPLLSLLPVMPTVKILAVGLPEAFFATIGEIQVADIRKNFPNIVTLKLSPKWLAENKARITKLKSSINIVEFDVGRAMLIPLKTIQAHPTNIIVTSAK